MIIMAQEKSEIQLKVGELTERGDFGRGIVRISSRDMKKLSVTEGDIVEIEGKRKTAAVAIRAYPVDVGLDIVRMDGLERRNSGAGIGDIVRIRSADVKEAKSITLAPARKGLIIHVGNNIIKQNLLMRPFMTGDIIIPNPIVQDRRNQTTLFEQFFGVDFGEMFFTPFGEEKFVVVNTEPKGIVRMTRATDVELLPQATKAMDEEKIPEVTYEDLGGLHEEIKKVREMIELPLKHPELFERLGIEPPKGILLHGPPGTGKTLLAKAVANESGAKFLVMNGPECMSKFYGESLTPDENIFTIENGLASVNEIGEIVKSKSADHVAEFDDIGMIEKGKIKSFIEHPFQEGKKIFEITTSTGRKIKVTDYHSLFALKNGKIVDIKTSDINTNDTYLAIPSRLPAPETYDTIDILRELADSEDLNVRSPQIKEFIKTIGIQKSAQILNVKEKYVYDIYGKDVCISIKDFLRLADESNVHVDYKAVNIVAKQNAGKLPSLIEIDEDMATVIGLFLAEGSYTTKDAIRITNELEESKEIVRRFCKKYGIYLTEYEDDMLLNSKPLKIVFEKILGIRTGAENKEITPKLMSMPLNLINAMMRGYFTGDGSVYPPKMAHTIEGSTHSRKLANSLMYTLLYFGIVAKCNVSREKYNGKLKYRILIQSPEGFKKFSEIGFLDDKRNQRINNYLISKKFDKTQKIPIWPELREMIKARQNLRVWSNSKTIGKDILKNELLKADPKKEVYKDTWNVIDSELVWDKVIGMKEIEYNGNVYDVSVNPNENFVAGFGGIFAHNSEENLRKLFEQAEKNAPSIVFIDEIDAIAPKREEVKGEVEKRVVSQLLTLLDGLKSRGKVIVIGATNLPNSLDPALRRPGRFDREIELGVPNKDGRKEILQIHTRGMPLLSDVNIEKISEITYGYVGADLLALCKESAMHALRRVLPDLGEIKEDKPIDENILKRLVVTGEDFEHALKIVEPSAMREVLIETPKVRWSDIGGLEEVKNAMKEVIEWPLKYADSFKKLGIRPPTGVLLYGPPGCGKCVTGDTEVLHADGSLLTIKDMYEHAEKNGIKHVNGTETVIENSQGEIISLNPKTLKLEKKPIKYFYRQAYSGDIITLTTRSGRSIRVTPEHPLFIIKNGITKKRSKDITKGDYIATPRKIEIEGKITVNNGLVGFNTVKNSNGTLTIQSISKFHPHTKKINTINSISPEFGELMGYFLAEGSKVPGAINFFNSDTNLIRRVSELSKNLFNIDTAIEKDTSEGTFRVECNSKTLVEYLKQALDYDPKNARLNKVPDVILRSTDNVIASFLRAFFDGEGCVRSGVPEIEITTASRDIANSIVYMLLRFGIVSRIRPKKVKGYDHTYWRLFIIGKNNLIPFKNSIGFSIKEKSDKLDLLLKSGKTGATYDIIPNIEKILEKTRTDVGMSKQKFYRTKHGKGYEIDGKHISRRQIQKIISDIADNKTDDLRVLSESDVMWDEVIDVTKEHFDGYVYDLTVEDNHNFVAGFGGIIAHNTMMAKAIANESGANFISVKGPELLSMYVGESERHIRDVFRRAKQVAPCITGDTLITLEDGSELTAKHIFDNNMIGTKVLSFDKNLKVIPKEIVALQKKPRQNLFSIKTTVGSIRCTPEHKFPIIKNGLVEWVEAKSLKIGNFVATPRQIRIPQRRFFTLEFLPNSTVLYGGVVDEMYKKLEKGELMQKTISKNLKSRTFRTRKGHRFFMRLDELKKFYNIESISCTDFVLKNKGWSSSISKSVKLPKFIDEDMMYAHGLIWSDGSYARNTIIFSGDNKTLHESLKSIMESKFGIKASDYTQKPTCIVSAYHSETVKVLFQKMTEKLLEMPESLLAAWLRGVCDGDGYISNDCSKICIGVTKKENRKLLQKVLLRVGIPTVDHNGNNIELTSQSQIQTFLAKIGFSHPLKAKRAQNYIERLSRSRLDVIPIGKLAQNLKGESVSNSTLHGWANNLHNPSRDRLQTLIVEKSDNTMSPIALSVNSDIFWAPVVGIEALPEKEIVYDLQIEDTENFLANGMFVHNCIIFFDEVDALVPKRSYSNDSHVSERVVSQLLAEISGLEELHDIAVVAATNRPDIVDPALLRPGRFDRQILVPTPDEKTRLEILKVHTSKMPLSEDVNIVKMSKETTGFSGADLESVVREAAIIAMRKDINADQVTSADFAHAMKEVKPSVSDDMNKFYESILKRRKSRALEEDITYTG